MHTFSKKSKPHNGAEAHRATGEIERALPHSLEAERSILGAILLDGRALNSAVENGVCSGDFFIAQHRHIFGSMVKIGANQQPIEIITLIEDLTSRSELEAAGGVAYLSQLADGLPRITNVEHYARIVKEKAVRRQFVTLAEAMQAQALSPDEDIRDIALRFSSIVLANVEASPSERLTATSAEELMSRAIKPRAILLDPIISSQSLTQLYGYRGDGKTFIALGEAAAVSSGGKFLRWTAPAPRRVLYIDGELPAKTLQDRLAMILAGMDTQPKPDHLRFITPDFQSRPMPDLSTAQGQAMIEPHLENIDFLILDNLSALCRSGVENEGESWVPIQDWLLRLRRRGIAVQFVHHSGKNRTQRGTSRREDLLDVVIALRHPSNYDPSEGLRVEIHFEKGRALFGAAAAPFEVSLQTGLDNQAIWTSRDLDGAKLEEASELFAAGISVRQAAEALGVTKSKAGRLRLEWEREQKRGTGKK